MRRLHKEGLITLKELYINGAKIEANANRYTFIWRGSINYHLAGLLDTIDAFYAKYNSFLYENGYGAKYNLGEARMFVIEGMEKVRKMIEANRHRKVTKHKNIPNNTIIESDKELHHIRTESKEQDGYTQTFEVYGCVDCSGCNHKARCLYKYNAGKNPDRNKVMKINERWEELKEESNANIQSETGSLKRQTRSIQTEGHFGDIKENEDFRRFNYRSDKKVYKEFMLYAIGRNIMKYHRFLHHEIENMKEKRSRKLLR